MNVQAPAASRAAKSSRVSLICGARMISPSCRRLVALTIGAADAPDQPGERDLRRQRVMARRHVVERFQNARAARVEIFLQPSAARRVLVGVGRRAVLAGEESGGEPVIGDDADCFLPAQRGVAGLEFIAVGQVVKRLQRLVARKAELLAGGERGLQPLRADIGSAGRAHFAGLDQRVIGRHRFLDRRHLVVEMRLVEVDTVGLQSAQRSFAFAQDVILLEAAAFAHILADLGEDQHAVAFAALLQPVADDGFGFAAFVPRHPARIGVGGVDAR